MKKFDLSVSLLFFDLRAALQVSTKSLTTHVSLEEVNWTIYQISWHFKYGCRNGGYKIGKGDSIVTVIRFLISPLILTVNTVSGQSNQFSESVNTVSGQSNQFSEYDLGPPTME